MRPFLISFVTARLTATLSIIVRSATSTADSRAVTKLIKNGRIDREFADADKRRSILNLSEDGKKLHDEIAELALGFERDLLEGLSPDELEQLNSIMERLLARARLIGTP